MGALIRVDARRGWADAFLHCILNERYPCPPWPALAFAQCIHAHPSLTHPSLAHPRASLSHQVTLPFPLSTTPPPIGARRVEHARFAEQPHPAHSTPTDMHVHASLSFPLPPLNPPSPPPARRCATRWSLPASPSSHNPPTAHHVHASRLLPLSLPGHPASYRCVTRWSTPKQPFYLSLSFSLSISRSHPLLSGHPAPRRCATRWSTPASPSSPSRCARLSCGPPRRAGCGRWRWALVGWGGDGRGGGGGGGGPPRRAGCGRLRWAFFYGKRGPKRVL
jgi:hypothetical protein